MVESPESPVQTIKTPANVPMLEININQSFSHRPSINQSINQSNRDEFFIDNEIQAICHTYSDSIKPIESPIIGPRARTPASMDNQSINQSINQSTNQLKTRPRTPSFYSFPAHPLTLVEPDESDIQLRISSMQRLLKLMSDQSTNQSIQSVNQSNQSINQSNRSINQPINQSVNRPSSKQSITVHQSNLLLYGVNRRCLPYLQCIEGYLKRENAYHLSVRAHSYSTSDPNDQVTHHAIISRTPIKFYHYEDDLDQSINQSINPDASFDLSINQSINQSFNHRPLSSLLSSTTPFHTFSPREALKESLIECLLSSLSYTWTTWFASYSLAEAKKLSKAERISRSIDSMSLVYGEISFDAMSSIIWSLTKLRSGGVFVDLGSGTGRAVTAAILLHDFTVARGLECLESLWKASCQVKQSIEIITPQKQHSLIHEVYEPNNQSINQLPASRGVSRGSPTPSLLSRTLNHNNNQSINQPPISTRISFEFGSFLEIDWSDADVVFANSTCFDPELMNEIGKRCEKLKIGSYVITLTKRLETKFLTLCAVTQYEMTWGAATVLTYRRNRL